MKFNYNDGGRLAAGYRGHTGDCVCRAITIATGLPYKQVYDRLAYGNCSQRSGKTARSKRKVRTAADGIYTQRKWFKDYMKELGFTWIPTMGIGTGCKVHLTDGELPNGRLVCMLSRHATAVVDQVINDIYNPERSSSWLKVENGIETRGTSRRCVYGYYILNNVKP